MKLLLTICILVSTLSITLGSVSVSLPSKKTDCSSGTCVDVCDYDKAKLLPGESFNDECSLVVCHEDFSMNFEGCGVASTDDCKLLGHDLTLKYPDCCNKICLKPAK